MDIHNFYRLNASRLQRLSLSILLLFVGVISATAQQCNSELVVEKNRKYKSISEEGATFSLLLKNNTREHASYSISTKQLEEACGNDLFKSNKPNVPVNVTLSSSNKELASNSTITVAPNSIQKFKVIVNALDGSETNTWGCVQVTATAKNCTTETSTVLSAWVSDNVE